MGDNGRTGVSAVSARISTSCQRKAEQKNKPPPAMTPGAMRRATTYSNVAMTPNPDDKPLTPSPNSFVSGAEPQTTARIFFVGGFLAKNTMAMKTIALTFSRLGCPPPLFLKHADFLGALGAVGSTL